nr:AAA domain protein [uncultured bacterium]
MITEEIAPILNIIQNRRVEGNVVVVALDGRSGVGKSTLAEAIAVHENGAFVDQDDFYSGGGHEHWSALSAEERSKLCIDWRRVREELLLPLISKRQASYVPFDWNAMKHSQDDVRIIEPANVIVVDGTYSTRTELLDLIDVTVLVTLCDSIRQQRLRDRERDDWCLEWYEMWDQAEDVYFRDVCNSEDFDIVIDRTPHRAVE